MARKNPPQPEIIGLLGVGLDNDDGHARLTRAEQFILVGGSSKTHEKMQDVAIRFAESLKSRGKRLEDASVEEVIDLLNDAAER